MIRHWGILGCAVSLTLARGQASASVPPCNPAHMITTYSAGSASGSEYITITVHNTSKWRCLLPGVPRLEQFDSANTRMKPEVRWPLGLNSLGEGARSVVVPPDASVQFALSVANGTGYGSERHCGAKLVVYLPRSTKSVISIPTPSCDAILISGYVVRP